jgi:hypothetical protein
MKKNNKPFKPTYFLSDQQIKDYQQWSVAEIFEWLETTNEFLNKFRTPEAKAFNQKIRKGEI